MGRVQNGTLIRRWCSFIKADAPQPAAIARCTIKTEGSATNGGGGVFLKRRGVSLSTKGDNELWMPVVAHS